MSKTEPNLRRTIAKLMFEQEMALYEKIEEQLGHLYLPSEIEKAINQDGGEGGAWKDWWSESGEEYK